MALTDEQERAVSAITAGVTKLVMEELSRMLEVTPATPGASEAQLIIELRLNLHSLVNTVFGGYSGMLDTDNRYVSPNYWLGQPARSVSR